MSEQESTGLRNLVSGKGTTWSGPIQNIRKKNHVVRVILVNMQNIPVCRTLVNIHVMIGGVRWGHRYIVVSYRVYQYNSQGRDSIFVWKLIRVLAKYVHSGLSYMSFGWTH